MKVKEVNFFLGKKRIKMVKSREFINIFFCSCHAIKLKVNGLNRLKAKNRRENLYQSGKVNNFPSN